MPTFLRLGRPGVSSATVSDISAYFSRYPGCNDLELQLVNAKELLHTHSVMVGISSEVSI
jgi:hypothetical protein